MTLTSLHHHQRRHAEACLSNTARRAVKLSSRTVGWGQHCLKVFTEGRVVQNFTRLIYLFTAVSVSKLSTVIFGVVALFSFGSDVGCI